MTEEKDWGARTPSRVVAGIFTSVVALLVILYGLAWSGRLLPGSKVVSYFPDLERMPGFAQRDTLLNLALTEEQMAVLTHLDSIEPALAAGSEEIVRQDSVQQPPTIPQLPEGVPCIPLEYDTTGRTPLGAFYDKLLTGATERGQVRILHFGDSQIEGDRITSYLRSRLQRDFGGAGIGLVSVVPPVNPPYGLKVFPSAGWELKSMMPANARKKSERYGILGSVCHFSRRTNDDSLGVFFTGEIEVKRKLSAGRGMKYQHCRVFTQCDSSMLRIAMLYGDSIGEQKSAMGGTLIEDIRLAVAPDREEFRLRFQSEERANVYGMSLESPTGIQVDNIPLRGSSGTDFTAMDSAALLGLLSHLKPSLVLLQFGVNVVPGKVEAGYGFYTVGLVRQIRYLERLLPGVPIVLIGVSDMGEKVGEFFRSYENISRVQSAQRLAAKKTRIAFWDCRQAMGGENAIVAWVQANPPLATSDYVHFTPRGARYVGELLYTALMADYAKYVKSRK